MLPQETGLPKALLGFERLNCWQGAFGASCELFCYPEALEISQYQWLYCLAYFPAWDTCYYYLFFNVLITDVLMLSLGRLTWRGFHFAHLLFSFLWTMMGNITLGANAPSWTSDAVADRPKATTESAHFPTVSWLTVLISNSCVWR